jgi:hypothetical protein
MSVFGDVLLPEVCEEAALATLWAWMPTYMANIEREAGVAPGTVARPKSWKIITDWDQVDADRGFPALAVVATGVTDPVRDPDGTYSGWVSLTIGAAAVAKDRYAAHRTASRLLMAALATLLGKPHLPGEDPDGEGVAIAVDWPSGINATETPPGDKRNRSACTAELRFHVVGIATVGAGPVEAVPGDGTDDVAPWPTANDVDIDITVTTRA